ncbi:MAG: hypothetical protein L0216_11080 [Planctomycetales bacterium]|nr:hypothetical protein [Planctomycetales bacterium]
MNASATTLCGGCSYPVSGPLPPSASLRCGRCGGETAADPGSCDGGRLLRCAFCGGTELYRQRDFHTAIGCGIMLVAATISVVVHVATGSFWWVVPLAAGVAVDLVCYALLPDRAGCYACHAEFRGIANLAEVPPYDLHTATRVEYARGREGGEA